MENSKSSIIFNILIYLTLILFVVFFIFPIVWLIITSLKPAGRIYSTSLPNPVTFDSYRTILSNYDFDNYFSNSLIVASISTAIVALVSIMGAYGFSKFKYRMSDKIFIICVLLRMIPFITLILPLYMYISKLGIMNTKLALIVANTTFNLPMALWIMETFFRGFPDEMIHAASVDGSSNMNTLWKIVVPISLPSVSAVVILTFLSAWNEFMFAFVTTSNEVARPLTVAIALLTQDYGIRWDLMTAAGTLYIIPTLLFTTSFQKYIISGLTLGAVKG